MVEFVSPSKITPARYNPRRINQAEFRRLCDSISCYGFVLPVLVNSSNGVVVAGHQRLKAALELGMTTIPVIYVRRLNYGDEIRLNQIHNGIGCESYGVCLGNGDGFSSVRNDFFDVTTPDATFLKETCNVLTKYGNILSCVVCSGDVVAGGYYVKACQLLGFPVTCCFSPARAADVRRALSARYGSFCYDHLPRHTFVQGLAQMKRLSCNGRKMKSVLYENHVIPWLVSNPTARVLDFGAGKCEYSKLLAKSYCIDPLEFYPNNGRQIIVGSANSMINTMCSHLEQSGLYDAIVCDSVLNSVDCSKAEDAVLICCNAFLPLDGLLFISDRPIDAALEKQRLRVDRNVKKRFIEFLDEGNFTANYRAGNWYYQHYHARGDVENIISSHGFHIEDISWRANGDSWQAVCRKISNLSWNDICDGVSYEFNLPLPEGRSFAREKDVIDVLRPIYHPA